MNSIRQMFHVTYCESTSKGLSPGNFVTFVKWLNSCLYLKLFWVPVLHQDYVRRGPVCAYSYMIGDSWAWQQLCKDEWQDSWCHGVPELVCRRHKRCKFDPGLGRSLEVEMATNSRTLAWRIPCTEGAGRPQSMGSQRVRHGWVTELTIIITQVSAFIPCSNL